jgi:hypothetical protein
MRNINKEKELNEHLKLEFDKFNLSKSDIKFLKYLIKYPTGNITDLQAKFKINIFELIERLFDDYHIRTNITNKCKFHTRISLLTGGYNPNSNKYCLFVSTYLIPIITNI